MNLIKSQRILVLSRKLKAYIIKGAGMGVLKCVSSTRIEGRTSPDVRLSEEIG